MRDNEYLLVEYELYGMQKNIIFNTESQYHNWEWALNKLNDDEYTAFKIINLIPSRY